MSRIFLSTSFSNQVDEDGNINPEFRQKIEKILGKLESRGDSIFCALRQENWKISKEANPSVFAKNDLDNVESCDHLIVILEPNVSAGAHIEIGYALAKGIKVTMTAQNDTTIPFFDVAISGINNVGLILYQDIDELCRLL